MADNTSKPAPYMGYNVFIKSIETLAETTVPSGPIDRRVLSELSGADYGALISGLKFFDFVDDQRKATAKYRELVELWKDQAKFKHHLAELLVEGYLPVIGNLDMKRGTAAELEKAFKDYGVAAGQMLTKSIRFFLKAMSESGWTLSPHMTARKPRSPYAPRKNGTPKPKGVPPRDEDDDTADSTPDIQVPSGFERLPLPGMPNSFIQYPANLTEAHCQVIEAMVTALRTSVKARTGGKAGTP